MLTGSIWDYGYLLNRHSFYYNKFLKAFSKNMAIQAAGICPNYISCPYQKCPSNYEEEFPAEVSFVNLTTKQASLIFSSSLRRRHHGPKLVTSSTPKLVTSSSPKLVTSSSPKLVTSSSPKLVTSSSPKLGISGSPKLIFSSSGKPDDIFSDCAFQSDACIADKCFFVTYSDYVDRVEAKFKCLYNPYGFRDAALADIRNQEELLVASSLVKGVNQLEPAWINSWAGDSYRGYCIAAYNGGSIAPPPANYYCHPGCSPCSSQLNALCQVTKPLCVN